MSSYVKHLEYLLYLDETMEKIKWLTIGLSIFFNKHLLFDKPLLSYNSLSGSRWILNKHPEAYGSV